MTYKEIVDWLLAHYCDYRRPLVPLLQQRLVDGGHTERVHEALRAATSQPMRASGAGTDEMDEALRAGTPDLANLGDQCDYYTIVLNPEITEVEDWDFKEVLIGGAEVHLLRLWVNWLLPVYYAQTVYLRGWKEWVSEEASPLREMMGVEAESVAQVHMAMAALGFRCLGRDFVRMRDTRLITDLSVGNASYFECLFSDYSYPWEDGREEQAKWRGGWD